jgi:predicted RNase H-like HicB family nuclease
MGAHDKLLGTILRGASDANIAFEDLRQLLRHLGFDERTRGSHHLFRKSGIIDLINLQREGEQSRDVSSAASPGGAAQVSIGRRRRRRLIHKYEIIIYWSNEDRAFVAEVPELPGCMAHGDSQAAVLANAKDAMQLWLDAAKEFGHPILGPKGQRLMLA